MEQYQQAALSLHAMHASDRRWLLEQLPVSQRSRLASMLDELEQLGVPREPVLLEEVSNAQPAPSSVHPLVEPLRRQDARQLGRVLEAEPDAVAVALLGRVGPWRDDVLAGLPAARREAIEGALDRVSPLPDSAYEALCEATLLTLEITPGDAAAAHETPAPRRRWLEKLPWRR